MIFVANAGWRKSTQYEKLRTVGTVAVDIRQLSRDEQLLLLDQLWENLGRDPGALPLTDAQRGELEHRLDDLDSQGPVGISWDDLVAELRTRSR